MFEDYTYELLMEDVLNNAPEGIDTRQGSVFYDAVSGPVMKIAKLYTDLDLIVEMTSVSTAVGDALDVKAGEYGVTRLAATKAKYRVSFEGTQPELGERFYSDGKYFVLREDTEASVFYLEAENVGEDGNEIYSGTPAVPVNSIEGLEAATFGEIYERGSDSEDDESLRSRVQEKIAGPAENGNKQHYKTWCESREGVGRARIFPLWNGRTRSRVFLLIPPGSRVERQRWRRFSTTSTRRQWATRQLLTGKAMLWATGWERVLQTSERISRQQRPRLLPFQFPFRRRLPAEQRKTQYGRRQQRPLQSISKSWY